MGQIPPDYPASLEIDYPDREVDRLSTLLRIFAIIPIAIIYMLVSGGTLGSSSNDSNASLRIATGGVLVFPTMLMLLFRQKYPRWWFDWNIGLLNFGTRVSTYLALLRDEYPSTDEVQAVHIQIPYPDARNDLDRWLPLVKWLLAFPHYIALAFLGIAATICVIIAWFAILITGRYPRSLFDFVVSVYRWGLRVTAYAFLLTTDRYPPFSLDV